MVCFNLRKIQQKNPMIRIHFTPLLISLYLLLFASCKSDPLKVNVSDVEVDISIKRFDQDFYALKSKLNDEQAFTEGLDKLRLKYGHFYYDWIQMPELMGIGNVDDPNTTMVLKEILSSSTVDRLMGMINTQYKDFSKQEKEFESAYKHFRYYFPNAEIPDIVTFFSNFSMTMNPVGNGYIGISLDMHLGDTFYVYSALNPPIEKYFHKLFVPENIVSMHFLAHGRDMFYHTNKGEKFSDEMFFWGKLLYFTEAMMPKLPKHLIIGYTEEEYKLCLNDEKDIWTYFVKDEILYSSDKKVYMRHFTEGPYTIAPGVPANTPPMLGKFVGWQAVRTFMAKNKDVSLAELMEMTDAESFLRKVKYKP